MNYRAKSVCGLCPYFRESSLQCNYVTKKFLTLNNMVDKPLSVFANFGSLKCWIRLEAMNMAIEKTGSAMSWEFYANEVAGT